VNSRVLQRITLFLLTGSLVGFVFGEQPMLVPRRALANLKITGGAWCDFIPGETRSELMSLASFSVDDVEAGRTALEAQSDLPWYDSDTDQVQRIRVVPPLDDTHRESEWATELEGEPSEEKRTANSRLFWDVLQSLAWALLAAILIAAVVLLVVATRRRSRRRKQGELEQRETTIDPDRLEDLPIPIADGDSDLLAAARRAANSADYNSAIKFLYSFKLLELDKHHCIELTRGKTNRQYLRELQRSPDLRELLQQTMLPFEAAFFGQHRVSQETFQRCWQLLTRFHDLLERSAS
jgi:hypothetical protein